MITLRLFLGFLLQMAPFAFLALYPYKDSFRLAKAKVIIIIVFLLLFLDIIFTCFGNYLYVCMPHNNQLFISVNLLFMILLIPCAISFFFSLMQFGSKSCLLFPLH